MSGYPIWNGPVGGEGFYEDDTGLPILCKCGEVAQECSEKNLGKGDWEYTCGLICKGTPTGTLFNINRPGPAIRFSGQRITGPVTAKDLVEGARRIASQSIHPGDAHWTESFCPETGAPQIECRCQHCAPATQPTAFPAAPAAPEICWEDYAGIPCTNVLCQRPHRLPRK